MPLSCPKHFAEYYDRLKTLMHGPTKLYLGIHRTHLTEPVNSTTLTNSLSVLGLWDFSVTGSVLPSVAPITQEGLLTRANHLVTKDTGTCGVHGSVGHNELWCWPWLMIPGNIVWSNGSFDGTVMEGSTVSCFGGFDSANRLIVSVQVFVTVMYHCHCIKRGWRLILVF